MQLCNYVIHVDITVNIFNKMKTLVNNSKAAKRNY